MWNFSSFASHHFHVNPSQTFPILIVNRIKGVLFHLLHLDNISYGSTNMNTNVSTIIEYGNIPLNQYVHIVLVNIHLYPYGSFIVFLPYENHAYK